MLGVGTFDSKVPVERALTPPAAWYVDKTFFENEKERVFRNSWQAVGNLGQLLNVGDFFSGQFMGQPYVVTRSEDGEIRAFYNVCRHHAAELVHGQGCQKKFSCPYHGWTYSLSGDLIGTPRLQGIEDFDKSQFGLKPLAVCVTGSLIWLGFNRFGQSPNERFAGVWSSLAETGFGKLQFHSRRSYEMSCNWKVYVDNYLDGGYHVSVLHKQLTGQLQLKDYHTEVAENYSLQSCSGQANERIGAKALYYWLYPNLMINRYGPVMDINWVVPLAVDRCAVVFDFFFASGTDEKFIAESLVMSERVQQEDIQISESVQRGLDSGAYNVGRYAPQVEHAMHAFHCRLAADF